MSPLSAARRPSGHGRIRAPLPAAAIPRQLPGLRAVGPSNRPAMRGQARRLHYVQHADLLTASSMAIFGVRATGVAAAVVGGVISARLVGAARRPRAGAVAFSVAEMANLLDGRVTFAVGVTLAAGALLAVQVRRPLLAAPLAAVAYFANPLAELFLDLALVAVIAVDPSRRQIGTSLAVLLAILSTS